MADPAQLNRSLSTIRTELEFLASTGILRPEQLQSIGAQLPQNNKPSPYTDPRFVPGAQQFNPARVALEAQDPGHPANPANPKHHEWAAKLARKFGNAAVMGAGATFGADLVNDAMRKF